MIAWKYLDKRSAVVDALKDYDSMEYILSQSPVKLEDEQSRLTSAPSSRLTGTPKAHNPQAGETVLAATLDEIDVIKERYRCALEYMEWFQPAWDALTEDERFVLDEFYLSEASRKGDCVSGICEYFNIERSSAYNRKNRALTRLALLLYGK